MSSSKWKEILLGDYINIKHGYAFKGEFFSETETEDILVTPGNFKIGGGFKEDKLKFYNGECPEEYVLKPNDVIVTMTDLSKIGDTLGYSALVPHNEKRRYLHNQRIGLVEFLSQVVNPSFIYWRLRSNDYQKFIVGSASGSTVKHTSPKTIKSFRLNLPPLPEQSAIAATLSCLDDMIKLNNRTNQVLEEMAQAIFKHWFVEFEFPNEDGQPYKSSGGEMADSELGEIPQGWRVGSLLDIADYLNGLAMQKFRPKEDEKGYPVLKIKELRQGMTNSSSEMCSENINLNYIVNDGDLIFSWSGSLLVDFWCGGKCGLNQHLFKVTSDKYDKWYCYYWTNYHLQKFIGIAKDKATTMGHIKRGDLEKSQVLIMDDTNYRKLASICKPIIETIIANRVENRKLILIRDTLLPKLMSGEIRVPTEEVC
ncbi:MAG: restriction endonuclease subunit S [Desulfitobacteriaceae bacterium]|nr:restriction endonuclease subunit S [Desulfitobacteriaceae bacterium]